MITCPETDWYRVPRPYDSTTVYCDTECPGDWLTTKSDGLNWCFEPPVDFSQAPVTAPTDEVYTQPPFAKPDKGKTGDKTVEDSVPRTPVWVFGLVAVVGVFSLAAVMSTTKSTAKETA
jgi:hypothetical protein